MRSSPLNGQRGKGHCIQCSAHMSAPRFRDATRTEWLCSDECSNARKRDWKRKRAAERNVSRGFERRRTKPCRISDAGWDRLSKRNAHEAWRYWLERKAPDWWLRASRQFKYADKPWNAPDLTPAERFQTRYRNDPEFRLGQLLRNYRRKAARGRYGERLRSALKNATNSKRLAKVFGFSLADLRAHLERQFTKGMSWERFNAGEIHIDHRRPLASFDLEDPEQFRAAWALTNLQPLWKGENLSKGARVTVLC